MEQRRRHWIKRLAAVVLSLCMMAGMVVVEPLEAQAMTTQSEAVAWARSQVGSRYNEGYGIQCVALISKYCDYLGASHIYGNAEDFVSSAIPAGWSRLAGASPQPGDVAIWTGGVYAENGHVAIVLSANSSSFEVIDQNGGGHQEAGTIRTKSYGGGYWGVIRPNFNAETPPAPSVPHGFRLETGGVRTISDGDYHIVSGLVGDRFNHGSKCLTIGGLPGSRNDNNANALLWDCLGNGDHVFTVTWLGNGFYKIKLKSSDNKCLDVSGGDTAEGANVQQWQDNGLDPQQWLIREHSDGVGYTIQSRCNGYYLDVENGNTANGTNIRMWTGNDSMAQRWYFVPWGGGGSARQEIQNGEYHIVPKSATNMTLNAAGNSTAEETNVIIWPSLEDRRHTFYVNWLGNGYYALINSNSSLALDVCDGQSRNGANLKLYRQHEGNNQKWIIKACGDGSYNIISKCNGLYLDLNDGKTAAGTNVYLRVGDGASTQKWLFVPYTEKAAVKFVSLGKTSLTLEAGAQSTLTATVSPANAANQTLTWTSSNTAVATVDGNGVVTATVSPANAANQTLTWTSSNTAVATVDSNGVVTAKSAGTVTITVKTANGKTATCSVVVKKTAEGSKDQTEGGKDQEKTDCTHVYRKTVTPATMDEDGSIVEECRKCGYEKNSTVIPAIDTVRLSKTRFLYNGRVQEPEVTVEDNEGRTLTEGEDYTVSVDGNAKKVGRYTVVVEFEGNYEGETERTFDIIPKGTAITELTAKKHGFRVSWRKRTSQTTGYEIAYSTSLQFAKSSTKTVLVKKNKTTSKSVLKLDAGKKYYVRIRTYKTVKCDGETIKIYSGWSEKKTIVVKK